MPLDSLNGDMPEKKLNLLQFATCRMAELGTRRYAESRIMPNSLI
jgi:hypothetical protein